MNRDERLKDWYIRYQMILGRRYTKKQKSQFLQSVSADIHPFRSDIEMDTFKWNNQDKHEYRNLYIGDIKKAEKIICTYYDTPAVQLGSYHFFDVEHRKRGTITWIGISSFLFIIFGFLYTLYAAIPVFQARGLVSFLSVLSMIGYLIYFYFLNKITRGWPHKKNLIRNTSSVLLLLDYLSSCKSKKIAFALLDAGCTNHAGLDKMMGDSKASVYMLDSIGSKHPLYQVSKNDQLFVQEASIEKVEPSLKQRKRLLYLISGKKENDSFILSREDLQNEELNEMNMNLAYDFLDQVVRRK